MRVIHDGDPLATDVEVAGSLFAKIRGLMFRAEVPEDFALVFPFDRVGRRDVNMLFMRTPIDVVWVAEERVTRTETLTPWTGFAVARADTVVELAAGAAAAVETGDRVTVAESD